ncbi:MAG: DUF3108 domain-containing protein [Gemmatimonadaceae bacterium]|nr:DUF3108 domain-containing protein [Gemmatimonadaceae bacterium]
MPRSRPVTARLRRIARASVLLIAAAVIPVHLDAQTTLREHLDPARLHVGRDSFVVMIQGQPRGWQRLTVERAGTGWTVGDAITIDSLVTQGSRITLDAALHEQSLRQEGRMRGRDMRIVLDFAGGRVRGSALTPSAPAALQVDTVVAAGTVDDNAVAPLLAAVRLRDSLDISFPVLASGKGTVSLQRLRVTGRETVTVPAGTFDAWRVELTAERSRVLFFVSQQAPHRVVKMSNGPAFEMLLLP